MRCLMFGLACNENQFDRYIKEHINPYSVAHFLFETKLIQELESGFNIDHNYIFQGKNYDEWGNAVPNQCENITAQTKTKYLGYLNCGLFKFITLFLSTLVRIFKYNMASNEPYFILSTINYMPVALAVRVAAKILHKKNVIIFTDCSTSYAYSTDRINRIKGTLRRINKKIVSWLEKGYDAYILFSEPMNDLVNPRKKPYCVMEGFFNPDELNFAEVKKREPFTIMYAGSILSNLGLQNLVLAVKQIHKDLELHIYGDGDYKDELEKLCEGDDRIKIKGFLDRKTLFEEEKKASLMVNVRDPGLAYTKFSFPSKTFEYLASGTPFMSTKLECYPSEYEDHIFFIVDNKTETIAHKIAEVMELSIQERRSFGYSAKRFILEQKNSRIQGAKVKSFLKEVAGFEE